MQHRIRRWIRDRRQGFSLLELLAAMIILATLIKIAMPTFLDTQDEGYQAAMMTDLRNLVPQMQMHFSEFSSYPAAVVATGPEDATRMLFTSSPDVRIELSNVSNAGFTATASHAKLTTRRCTLNVAKGQGPRVECAAQQPSP